MNELTQLSLTDACKLIRDKKISSHELTSAYLQVIESKNSKINAVVNLNPKALERAKHIDDQRAKSEPLGALAGVPILVKEMFCTEGLLTTACSHILENFVPPYTATTVKKLEQQGAIVIGKCNQDEFAMGSSNEHSIFGPCNNPWQTDCVAGGSSGGSAAAVASGMSLASLGTDTGGSIRQPASFCGVVGVKPTYGRVSRYGIIAFASSLDQAGPFARNTRDAVLVTQHMCGHDPRDATTSSLEVPDWLSNLSTNISGLKVGVPKEYFQDGLNTKIKDSIEKILKQLEEAGAIVVEISLPHSEFAIAAYYVIATSEASSNLSRYDGIRFGRQDDFAKLPPEDLADFYSRNRGVGFGTEVKRRILLGTFALSSGYYDAYYKKASQVRRLIKEDFTSAFKKCDVIVSPTTPDVAFAKGEKADDPMSMYLNDIYTTSANLAGIPAMSLPIGRVGKLPFGAQIMAPDFSEQNMFNLASFIEENCGYKFEVANV